MDGKGSQPVEESPDPNPRQQKLQSLKKVREKEQVHSKYLKL